MSDEMIVVHVAHDISEADIIKGMLEDEGIPVFVQGYNHRSMLGVVGAYVDINIMVSRDDTERAKQCIAQAQVDIALPAEDSDPIEAEEVAGTEVAPGETRPKSWMVAIMLPFLLPGLGSYYVGRGDVGGWFLTLAGLSYVVLFASRNESIVVGALILIPVLIVTDLLISITTLRNARKEKP